jgi:uncharacterized membrane protein YeaQ/YmgE (transglycosylase-associated protein family)
MPPLVYFLIWIVIGVLAGALADPIWKGRRPYGEIADYIVAIIATIITGLLDWYVLPRIGITGTFKFVIAVIEPALVALFALWIMRIIRKEE